ncbi:hypothetical protein NliqN6_4537 [Naganishia liquefaciens]|uniref:Uncharacterized protein n=1 Tax=Naganishia liquefaciens TaxID=104408 RepID=A0A8H3YFW0_9TREE|nr:hypothetical protein NliqN6_4537 [Naganishia liquefaciens]
MLKLSHILPPGDPSTDKPEPHTPTEETCPRAIIGAVPAGSALHLAIAYQLQDRLQHQLDAQGEFGVDDLTIPECATSAPTHAENGGRSTLILASPRSRWHESLMEENDVWLRDHGGRLDVADALRKVEVRYCSESKDARVLNALLHVAEIPESNDASCLREIPGLIIAWDLFGLFVADETVQASTEEDHGETAEGKDISLIESETVIQEYLSLLASLRQACEQISIQSESATPTLIILEPHLSSCTEIRIAQPMTSLTIRPVDRKNQRYMKILRGLEWILAPGYADHEKRRTVLEITKTDEEDDDIEGRSSPNYERYTISSGAQCIAAFERREEDRASGRPWLDKVASHYEWIRP